MYKGWLKNELTDIIGGKWLVEPADDWRCRNLAVSSSGCEGPGTLFVAIDKDRWLQGTGNTGAYAEWTDTHTNLPQYQGKIGGAVVERHIKELDPFIPQLLVENSYEVIKKLGLAARDAYSGKIIAITGTSGKSSTKMMVEHLLRGKGTVESTSGNHNSRTGVALTLGRCVTQSDFTVIEVAISALWMRSGGICKLVRPHVAVVTEIALGQIGRSVQTVRETARMKARIAQGIQPGGIAVLNRDMPEFDLVKAEVIAYGANVISYGFLEDADFRVVEWQPEDDGSWIKAVIGDRHIKYYLPALGRGMVSNSLAALAVVYALGIDPAEVADSLETIHLKESVLEALTAQLPKGGKAYILDDSYNATVASMLAAFEVFKVNAAQHKGKKICILGRLVNLGDSAGAIHKKLAQPLIDTGADLVFLYGDEMRYLLTELPEKMVAGFYTDIGICARDAASILGPDDYVLLKGSRRANDFGRVRRCLLSAIKKQHELQPFIPGERGGFSDFAYGLQAVDMESGETLLSEGNIYIQVNRGLGSLLLLARLLENIARGKMKLNEYVTINSSSARESKASAAIGFEEGEQVSLYTLLSLLICRNAPDAVLALAETMLGKTSEALKSLKDLARRLNLSVAAVENISGRPTTRPQYFTVTDLSKAGRYLFSVPSQYSKILNTTMVEYQGRLFNSTSHLVASGKIYGGFFFGPSNGEGTVLTYIGGKKVVISVCGARDNFQRDYLLSAAIARLAEAGEKAENPAISRKISLPLTEPAIIQFIGDTYFGEDYTVKRQRRGEEDALTKYGYDYSFEVLKPLLAQGSLNIANFEGVLTDLTSSPLNGIKPFVLGGRIQESVRALKNNHIHAVTLGNNHAMDYGAPGLRATLQAFHGADIPSAGAGLSGRDASQPLRILHGDQEIVIYSGYWYRRPAYYEFDSYAMGNKPGVACLNGELIERIAEDKRGKSSNAFIILAAHWGTDYGPILNEQKKYAEAFMDCGADLIIGHGAHLMQGIQQINGKWVIYSIGNGVFNSNGEYRQRKMPPYSYLLQLRIKENGEKRMRLYPIFTNNLETFWQPRFVTEEEFRDVIAYQTQLGTPIDLFDIGMDAYGYYTETQI